MLNTISIRNCICTTTAQGYQKAYQQAYQKAYQHALYQPTQTMMPFNMLFFITGPTFMSNIVH